jgi:hypothetical protein
MRTKSGLSQRRRGQRGFSLVEALVSSFIFVALLIAVYSALSDSMGFQGVQGTYIKMQMGARRALDRMSNELRMTGRFNNPVAGQPGYPYVFTGGVALGSFAAESHDAPAKHLPVGNTANGDSRDIVFKIPRDVDGDGLLTAAVNGKIEWSVEDISYVLMTDPNGINVLERRENGVVTDVLASYVERITFDTIDNDPTVGSTEVVITLYMAQPTPRGTWLQTNLTTCVSMRNTEEVH